MVVAIIGILVAVSIPIFSGQLEKSRRAVDMANARNIKSVLCTALNDGTLEMGDGAKLVVQIRKSDVPVVSFQGNIKLNGQVLWDKQSPNRYQYKMNVNHTGAFGDMLKLLNQSVGDVRKLRVKANRFITNTGKESDIAWYAVRLSSNGECRYGKGGAEIDANGILNTGWSPEEF